MMLRESQIILPMTLAAQAGGQVLKKYFGQSLKTVQKSTAADFKTKADDQSEAAILKSLQKAFPDYNILSEEAGSIDRQSDFTLVVDPLDGTNNFVLGIPNFTVSIGLLCKEELIAGVIYNPLLDHTYTAEKGKGAYMNGKRLRVNRHSAWENATINHICGYDSDFAKELRLIQALYAKEVKRVSSNWSAAFDFCMLASGRIEAVINSESALHDFAAGKIIAREAGALITDLSGDHEPSDKNRHFIASNGTRLHQQLVATLHSLSSPL